MSPTNQPTSPQAAGYGCSHKVFDSGSTPSVSPQGAGVWTLRNESIEGEKISGDSRDPLRFQRVKKINGKKCYLFKAEFNVHAEIIEPLASGTLPIDEAAQRKPGEKLSGDTAVITSLSQKFSSALESNFTSTHSGNTWKFSKQTNIKVITPRQQIRDAIQKRLDPHPMKKSLHI